MHVMKLAGQNPDTDHTFKASIGLDQKVELSFDWTPDGEVSILAGTETS